THSTPLARLSSVALWPENESVTFLSFPLYIKVKLETPVPHSRARRRATPFYHISALRNKQTHHPTFPHFPQLPQTRQTGTIASCFYNPLCSCRVHPPLATTHQSLTTATSH